MARSSGGFQWPPHAVDDQPLPELKLRALPRAEPGVWRQIEETFLGLTSPPVADALAEQGWRPNLVSEYCPTCGTTIGPHELDQPEPAPGVSGGRCPACRGTRPKWQRFVRLGEYAGVLRDAILDVKFHQSRSTAEHLGRLLGAELARQCGEACDHAVIVPAPVHWTRRFVRGIDHTLALARAASRASGVPIARALRTRRVEMQVGISAAQRRSNVRGSMRLVRPNAVAGKVVILLDDIRTTGATLNEAARALISNSSRTYTPPITIWAAVVAVTPEPDRRQELGSSTENPPGVHGT